MKEFFKEMNAAGAFKFSVLVLVSGALAFSTLLIVSYSCAYSEGSRAVCFTENLIAIIGSVDKVRLRMQVLSLHRHCL